MFRLAKLARASTWAALVVLTLTPNLEAQRFPSAPGGDGFSASANMAEFYAEVMMRVNELMTEWRAAWTADDLETLVDQYTEDATFVFQNEAPIRGREAIEAKLQELTGGSGEIQAAISDFDASGRMAMISGMLMFDMRTDEGVSTATGIHMTVMIRRGRHWRVRSQLFRLDQGLN